MNVHMDTDKIEKGIRNMLRFSKAKHIFEEGENIYVTVS